ncbi:P-loop containing nucleoside triphosphate hydrolases superfamily protein [Striga hermonthica]|uniref:Kinesin-like protein KIN-10A n=1 Tax=Striga hermonthica TaxID=68872 RepID=A0A9N7R9A8_STRHE|nr:P-loop containing nucleoside triphosphate hydrolases superfamily protein [Striga hermonthica]
MAPTPSSKSNHSTPSTKPNTAAHQSRTPQSKHRLQFTGFTTAAAGAVPSEHPVEVVGRIRDHPEQRNKPNANPTPALQINGDGKSLRVKTEMGYRDFSLDGISYSEEDDLEVFYRKFVESRVNGVKLGQKCTVMMYGPTGSGKSHTMFGCLKQPGIVYNSLKGILGEGTEEEDGEKLALGTFVQVTVLEIYNEEIYDLLSTGTGFGLGWPSKNSSASKVKLEVMGKKAKNATFISGNEAGKILKEIQKVEKRRIVKSTLCNERSSRSHCLIIVDVPTVGGRLLLVDMAGSENIEQAGQSGLEAKMQTAKINQGNIALKRVVESIANGDSHVPFRDSKLTMLLQDSFEDDKSKILMILCASPDPKELHKTIATLEYGAKAKCIVRGPHTPVKDKGAEDSSSAVILGSRIAALDQFICKLQVENKIKEKEKNEAQKELKCKEEEVSQLRAKLALVEGRASEEEINLKVNERTRLLKNELERKVLECQKMAAEVLEMERRKMEEKMSQQQREVEFLRQRLEDIEKELLRKSRAGGETVEIDGGNFMKRLLEVCNEDSDMVKSMDLSKSIDMETTTNTAVSGCINSFNEGMHGFLPNKACLTTLYEEDEYENEDDDDEVQKEVIEEKKMVVTPEASFPNSELENHEDATSSRQLRIQNIFTLCGNYRELSQKDNSTSNVDDCGSGVMADKVSRLQADVLKDVFVSDKLAMMDQNVGLEDDLVKDLKEEDRNPLDDESFSGDDDGVDVHVKWEASKENTGKFITTMKVSKDSSLDDLRKLIEIHLTGEAFTFLVLGDPSGAPVPKEKEGTIKTSKLPVCNNQLRGSYLACLRPTKTTSQWPRQPFSPLENKLVPTTPNSQMTKKIDDSFSPEIAPHLISTPFITVRRY